MNKSLSEKTVSGVLWNTGLPIFFQIFKFAISIMIARILEPKDFGIMSITSVIIFYANNLTTFGFSTALIQKKKITEDNINSVFTFNLSLSIILSVLTVISAKTIAQFFNIPELENALKVMSLVFIVSAFYMLPATLLRRSVEFKVLSIIEFCRGVFQTVTTLIMALMGLGYWALILGVVSSNLFGSIIMVIKTQNLPKLKFKKRAFKELLSFSLWNFMMGQIDLLTNYIDKLIIGKFLGADQIGLYEKSFSIAIMPVESISNRISSVMLPSFSRIQDDLAALRSYFLKALTTVSLICFPIFGGLAFIAPYFVTVLLGEKWTPMIPSLQILCIAFALNALQSIIRSFNIATGNFKLQVKIRFFIFLVMATTCFIFVEHGISIISTIILLSYGLLMSLSLIITIRFLSISLLDFCRSICTGFTSVLVMVLLLIAISEAFFTALTFFNLLCLTLIGAVIYCLCIIAFIVINFKETRFIGEKFKVLKRQNRP